MGKISFVQSFIISCAILSLFPLHCLAECPQPQAEPYDQESITSENQRIAYEGCCCFSNAMGESTSTFVETHANECCGSGSESSFTKYYQVDVAFFPVVHADYENVDEDNDGLWDYTNVPICYVAAVCTYVDKDVDSIDIPCSTLMPIDLEPIFHCKRCPDIKV